MTQLGQVRHRSQIHHHLRIRSPLQRASSSFLFFLSFLSFPSSYASSSSCPRIPYHPHRVGRGPHPLALLRIHHHPRIRSPLQRASSSFLFLFFLSFPSSCAFSSS